MALVSLPCFDGCSCRTRLVLTRVVPVRFRRQEFDVVMSLASAAMYLQVEHTKERGHIARYSCSLPFASLFLCPLYLAVAVCRPWQKNNTVSCSVRGGLEGCSRPCPLAWPRAPRCDVHSAQGFLALAVSFVVFGVPKLVPFLVLFCAECLTPLAPAQRHAYAVTCLLRH